MGQIKTLFYLIRYNKDTTRLQHHICDVPKKKKAYPGVRNIRQTQHEGHSK